MTELRAPHCVPDSAGHCSICGDEATAAQIRALDRAGGTALVLMGGVERTIALDLLEDAKVGDQVLVHMGFAIGRIQA